MMMKSYVMTRTFDFLCGVGAMFSPKTRGVFFMKKENRYFVWHMKNRNFSLNFTKISCRKRHGKIFYFWYLSGHFNLAQLAKKPGKILASFGVRGPLTFFFLHFNYHLQNRSAKLKQSSQ